MTVPGANLTPGKLIVDQCSEPPPHPDGSLKEIALEMFAVEGSDRREPAGEKVAFLCCPADRRPDEPPRVSPGLVDGAAARLLLVWLAETSSRNLTDYDQMPLVGVDREASRRRVQQKSSAMIATWTRPMT